VKLISCSVHPLLPASPPPPPMLCAKIAVAPLPEVVMLPPVSIHIPVLPGLLFGSLITDPLMVPEPKKNTC